MSAKELAEWGEFYALEPFGSIRDNWHIAIIAQLFANAHRRPGSPAVKLHEFMWKDPEARRKEQEAQVLAWFEEHAN